MEHLLSISAWTALRTWGDAATVTAVFFAALCCRYFGLVGFFSAWVAIQARRGNTGARRLYQSDPGDRQARSEILWSLLTNLAYACMATAVLRAWSGGWTLIYLDVEERGLGYLLGSVALVALFHETYFYWMHRLMHTEFLYQHVHRVHHQFVRPTPWGAFSFHPLEVVTGNLILPLLVFLIPLHPVAIAIYLGIMAVSGTMSHLGTELYPGRGRGGAAKGLLSKAVGRSLIGATHHAQHHRLYTYNYGLYLTLWDRLAGTQHPDFDGDFDRVTAPAPKPAPASSDLG